MRDYSIHTADNRSSEGDLSRTRLAHCNPADSRASRPMTPEEVASISRRHIGTVAEIEGKLGIVSEDIHHLIRAGVFPPPRQRHRHGVGWDSLKIAAWFHGLRYNAVLADRVELVLGWRDPLWAAQLIDKLND